MGKTKQQIDATVYGFVQGVSFRYYTQREAIRLGVVGWVANQANGTVRVVAQGTELQLNRLLQFLHKGSPIARVEQVKVAWGEPTKNFTGFNVRYHI
ncbi:MAG: acylphosphatase [Chloroflexi bacterium]|nr:MAG: acylphosphatase [Chloroflexota bacterium]